MTQASCGKKPGFNYCLVAKLIVAIPALPIVAFFAASAFENEIAQGAAAVAAVAITVYLAIWLDRVPLLQKKIRQCGCSHAQG